MKPTEKSQGIEDFITRINGISRREAMDLKICTVCKKEIKGFKDELSKKEYTISGLCQECQDSVFG